MSITANITKTRPESGPAPQRFTDEERDAMRERSREQKAAARHGKNGGESELLAKIAEMAPNDRTIAEQVHAVISAEAPHLSPKTWYGMPAYTDAAGKVVVHFQPAAKFKARYPTLGFSDLAVLDDGNMWATSFALTKVTATEKTAIKKLLKAAAGA